MQKHELKIGDLAHCDGIDDITDPFVGKVVAQTADEVCLEVMYFPTLSREAANKLHSEVWLKRGETSPFWIKGDIRDL